MNTIHIPRPSDAKQLQALTNLLKVFEDNNLITVSESIQVTAEDEATLATLNRVLANQKPTGPGRGAYARNTYRNPATGQTYTKKQMDALLQTENGIKPGFQFAHEGNGMLEVYRDQNNKLQLRKVI